MDAAMEILTDLAKAHNIATDSISHFNKGQSEPGDANRVRGASAQKDAARLVYTLSTMSKEEAEQFGVNEIDRPCLVRMDRAKVNFGRAGEAKWFKLIGVNLGNCDVDEAYPNGDEVQVAVAWYPPDLWRDLTAPTIHIILDEIEAGLPEGSRYTDTPSAKSRAAWSLIVKHMPDKTEPQARQIIAAWVKSGLLIGNDYWDKSTSKERCGLWVDNSKRPT
jgi:hypothetical protein